MFDTLFPDTALPPIARSGDPSTSHRAAEEITADGTRARSMAEALEAVKRWPGRTSNELEALTGRGDGKVRKRLADLLKLGLVKKGPEKVSDITGKMNQTWLAT